MQTRSMMSKEQGKLPPFVQIEKFDGQNYSTWRLTMTSLLKVKKMLSHVTAPRLVILGNSDLEALDEEVKLIIYSSLERKEQEKCGTFAPAFDLWKKIEENVDGASSYGRANAQRDFTLFSIGKTDTVPSYCGKFELLWGRLIGLGVNLDEGFVYEVFRNALPPKHKEWADNWRSANREGRVRELMSELKMRYRQNEKSGEKDESVFYSSQNKKGKNSKKKYDKRDGNTQGQGAHPSNSGNRNCNYKGNNNKKPFCCNFCGIEGHSWRKCNKLHEEMNNKKNQADKPIAEKKDDETSFIARDKMNEDKYVWIADSGASSHMTGDLAILSNFIEFENPKAIHTAGEDRFAIGHGEFRYKSSNGPGKLTNVLWIPQLDKNLFSLNKALDKGFKINFDPIKQSIEILNGTEILLSGKREPHRLPIFKMEPVLSDINWCKFTVTLRS